MKNATPKNEIYLSLPKNKEGRIKMLNQWDDDFLQKTHKLLLELKRAGVGLYKIKENEIKGLSDDEVSIIYYRINPLYQEENYHLEKFDRYISQKDKFSKRKIKVDGDIMGFPVFFFAGLEHGGDSTQMERTYMVGPQFETALEEIEGVLNKQIKKKVHSKIKGLIKPIKWEEITIIYTGESIKVKQNSTLLGEYNLENLGMPKIGKNKMEGVRQFFTSLFFPENYINNPVLSSKNNSQQKNKGNFSKIFKNIFETSKDPIQTNKKNHLYTPLFKVSMGKDLGINDFSSGRQFHDNDKAHYDDYPD